jgi:hypothetical protein
MFSLTTYFQGPAIRLNRANTWQYNSLGYRTHEQVKNPHIVVAGCSLTEGVGLAEVEETWPRQLEEQLGTQVINLGKGAANAEFVSQNLSLWLDHYQPTTVIAQWPQVFRLTHWTEGYGDFTTPHKQDKLYKLKLATGDEHFLLTFVKSVIYLDNKCKLKNVPVVHIHLDVPGPEQPLLEQVGINMHYNLKLPGKTWHFDSGAIDGVHHSEWCHTQWVKRIRKLL